MVLVLTLQLLTLLLATTGFAAPSSGRPPVTQNPGDNTGIEGFVLDSVFVGFGTASFNCTSPGVYEVFDFDVELFDATSLSGTENLEDVVDDIAVHVQDNPSVDVASYIQHTFDLNNSGQLSSINSTSIEIDVGLSVNGKNGDIAEIVTVTQDSEGGRGLKLANQEETIIVFTEVLVIESNGPSPSNSTCTVGSVATVDILAATLVYVSDEY
ncbi:hypothetical protein V8E53_002017, partial [Lactarius tabidus]